MHRLEHLINVQVFLCKFNRYTKALGAIFFESLSISGENSFNESNLISLKIYSAMKEENKKNNKSFE